MGWLSPLKKNWLPRTVRSKGAVSPDTLAIASRIPVITPLRAVLSTTLIVALHLRIPSAIAASRIELGTILIDSSVVRVIIGNIMIARATAPAMVENPLIARTIIE